jgi:hypothetical protein
MTQPVTITDEFCGWPYWQPYVYLRKTFKPRKAPKKRSAPAKDLATPKYRQRIVPNKKRKTVRKKVTLGGDEC